MKAFVCFVYFYAEENEPSGEGSLRAQKVAEVGW